MELLGGLSAYIILACGIMLFLIGNVLAFLWEGLMTDVIGRTMMLVAVYIQAVGAVALFRGWDVAWRVVEIIGVILLLRLLRASTR